MGLEPTPLRSQHNVLPVKLLPQPLEGVEPTPYGLQNQRSTFKLKELCGRWESNPHA